jgi:hypothetical protein
LTAIVVGYIDQKEVDLIQNELVPQFLGLWAKLSKNGVPEVTGKRGLALALLQTNDHLDVSKDWSNNDTVHDLLNEIFPITDKYLRKGLHVSLVSAGLERAICQILGTVYGHRIVEGYNEPSTS